LWRLHQHAAAVYAVREDGHQQRTEAMRRAAKRDANEGAIVAALEAAGCVVARLSGVGVPDLVVARQGRVWLLEVKDGSKPPSARALNPEQIKFHERWSEAPLFVVTSVDEALASMGWY
jgi:hypothetical protein